MTCRRGTFAQRIPRDPVRVPHILHTVCCFSFWVPGEGLPLNQGLCLMGVLPSPLQTCLWQHSCFLETHRLFQRFLLGSEDVWPCSRATQNQKMTKKQTRMRVWEDQTYFWSPQSDRLHFF